MVYFGLRKVNGGGNCCCGYCYDGDGGGVRSFDFRTLNFAMCYSYPLTAQLILFDYFFLLLSLPLTHTLSLSVCT